MRLWACGVQGPDVRGFGGSGLAKGVEGSLGFRVLAVRCFGLVRSRF